MDYENCTNDAGLRTFRCEPGNESIYTIEPGERSEIHVLEIHTNTEEDMGVKHRVIQGTQSVASCPRKRYPWRRSEWLGAVEERNGDCSSPQSNKWTCRCWEAQVDQ